jgi:hypothetical protein
MGASNMIGDNIDARSKGNRNELVLEHNLNKERRNCDSSLDS